MSVEARNDVTVSLRGELVLTVEATDMTHYLAAGRDTSITSLYNKGDGVLQQRKCTMVVGISTLGEGRFSSLRRQRLEGYIIEVDKVNGDSHVE